MDLPLLVRDVDERNIDGVIDGVLEGAEFIPMEEINDELNEQISG